MDTIDTRIHRSSVRLFSVVFYRKSSYLSRSVSLSKSRNFCVTSTNSPFQLHEQPECGQRRRDGAGGRVRRTVVRPQNRGRKLTPRKLGRAV